MKTIWKLSALALVASASLTLSACASGGWYGGVDGGATQLTQKQSALVEKQLAGKSAGQPVNCVSSSNLNNAVKVSDSMILYRVSKNLVYRNELRGSCMGLANDNDIMVTRSYGSSQLCNGDLIHMVDRFTGMPGGACSFGKFVPYRTVTASR